MRIAITGTPGTGKTEVAKEISRILKIPLKDVSPILRNSKIGYDSNRQCDIVDEEMFGKLVSEIRGDFVIEGHIAHYINPKSVDCIIVLTCSQKELKKRLAKKGWSMEKINENLDAENIKVILGEAMDFGHRIIEFDTTGKHADQSAGELAKVISLEFSLKM